MRRAKSSLGPVGVLSVGLAAAAAVCCVWSWMSYSYLLGDQVTVLPGASCLAALQATTGEVTCPDAMWVTGTTINQGTLVDYRQDGGQFAYDEIPARLVGTTARTQPPSSTYAAGLVGPPLLVGALGAALTGLVLRLRGRQRPQYPTYY